MAAPAGKMLCAAVGVIVACQATAADVDLDGGAALSSVSYRLAWDTGGVELGAAGGFTVTTDLGYRVTVDRGYLVSYLVQLARCETVSAGLLGVREAAAYHGEEVDPSVAGNVVESLTWPADRALPEVTFPRADYCRVHYVVASADGNTRSLPDDVGMESTSLYLAGRYLAPGAEAEVEFAVRAADATAILEALADAAVELDAGSEHADVRVVRSLAGLFDGVEFRDADADALQILANLRHGAWAEVSIRE